jgi:hypothetical protein
MTWKLGIKNPWPPRGGYPFGRWTLSNRQDRFDLRLARRTGDLLALAIPTPLLWLDSGIVPLVDDVDEPFEEPIVDLWQ